MVNDLDTPKTCSTPALFKGGLRGSAWMEKVLRPP